MQFTELTELNGFITETKQFKGCNSFNQKDKLPTDIDNLNTQQLLDIQLKMIQDDIDFESEEEDDQKKHVSNEKAQQKDTLQEEDKERHTSMISEMLDNFQKEETLKSKKQEIIEKRCKTVVSKIDQILGKQSKNRTASLNIFSKFKQFEFGSNKSRATTQSRASNESALSIILNQTENQNQNSSNSITQNWN